MTIFRPSEEERVRELLADLERPVELLLALGPEETPLEGARDIDFSGEARRLVEEIAGLAAQVTARVEEQPPGFDRFPAISIRPDGEDVALVGVLTAVLSSCSSSGNDKSSGHVADGGDAGAARAWHQVFTALPGALISVWGTSAKDVWAVPKVVVDGVPQYEGAVHERVFVQRLVAPVFE